MSGSGFDFDLFGASRAGIYAACTADLAPLAVAARDAGLRTIDVDLSGCTDKQTLLLRMETALDAPACSGRNWDALSDLLRDLDWLGEAPGYVLLLGSADSLRSAASGIYDTLLSILHETVDAWAQTGIPFWAFVGLPEDGLPGDGDESTAR